MTDMDAVRDELAQVIYDDGAYCGECEYEAWDTCSQCRAVVRSYADAVLSSAVVKRLQAEAWDRCADYVTGHSLSDVRQSGIDGTRLSNPFRGRRR